MDCHVYMDKKKHLIISAVIAVAFVVIVQLFATPQPRFRYLLPGFLAYVIGVGVYNWFYLLKNEALKFWIWMRIPLLLVSWFGVYFLVSEGWSRSLLLLASLPIIFFFESQAGNTGQQLGWNEFLLTLGTILFALMGLSYYFVIPGLIFMGLVFTAITVTVRSSLELVPHSNNIKWVVSLALGFFATQLFWVLNFLPFHFSVLTIIAFIALYVAWMLYYHYLYHTLNVRQIQFHLIFAVALVVIALLTTPWGIQS